MRIQPLVTVILPIYNPNSKQLLEAINSVLNQSYKNIELIIINDASTEKISKNCMDIIANNNRIRYVMNKENMMLSCSLNKWVWLSNGEYIARIDQDDLWPDCKKLEKQVDFMEENLDYWLCGTCVEIIDDNNNVLQYVYYPEKDSNIRSFILQYNTFAHSSVIIRKSILNRLDLYYNPKLLLAQDYDLWCRIGIISKFYNIQDIITYIRDNPESLSHKKKKRQTKEAFKICWKYKKYYPNFMKALIYRVIDILLPKQIIQFLSKIKSRLLNN